MTFENQNFIYNIKSPSQGPRTPHKYIPINIFQKSQKLGNWAEKQNFLKSCEKKNKMKNKMKKG